MIRKRVMRGTPRVAAPLIVHHALPTLPTMLVKGLFPEITGINEVITTSLPNTVNAPLNLQEKVGGAPPFPVRKHGVPPVTGVRIFPVITGESDKLFPTSLLIEIGRVGVSPLHHAVLVICLIMILPAFAATYPTTMFELDHCTYLSQVLPVTTTFLPDIINENVFNISIFFTTPLLFKIGANRLPLSNVNWTILENVLPVDNFGRRAFWLGVPGALRFINPVSVHATSDKQLSLHFKNNESLSSFMSSSTQEVTLFLHYGTFFDSATALYLPTYSIATYSLYHNFTVSACGGSVTTIHCIYDQVIYIYIIYIYILL